MDVTNGTKNEIREALRIEMPVSKKWAYFDHAAVGPLPARTAAAMANMATEASVDGDFHWPKWSAAAARLRGLGAALLHCDTSEIALVPNTSFGINVVANGLPWKNGDNLVVLENEFPSNMLPWSLLESRGVEVRRVSVDPAGRVDLDAIAKRIDASTRIVTVSWVSYATGYRLDLLKLCDIVHSAGSQLFVDAIQGLGVFPLDTQSTPIDYAAADGHKWMLGPEGAGLLYVRRKHLDHLQPLMTGWGSLQSAGEFRPTNVQLKGDASRYEGGSANHIGQIGFCESLNMLIDLRCHEPDGAIAGAVLENANAIHEGLLRCDAVVYRDRSVSDDEMSGIVSFTLPGHDSNEVRRQLIGMGVMLSVRHDRLRVATHAYNDASDIDRLLSGIKAIRNLRP